MTQTVYLEHAAKEAGYFLPDTEAEDGIRSLVYAHRKDPEEARNQAWLSIKTMTGGAVFSSEEVTAFMEGYSIKDILAVRIANSGEIRRPHSSPAIEEADDALSQPQPQETEAKVSLSGRDRSGRETAYCSSCQRMNPITFGYSERITGGVILDAGGPVDIMRTMNETQTQTFCAVCGHRVFTDAEAEELEREAENEKALWIGIGVFGFIAVLIIIAMMANAPWE